MTRRSAMITATALPLLFAATTALANHAWANYHWGRTSTPLPLQLGDNVSGAWDAYLITAAADWNVSPVLNTSIVAGETSPKTCKAVSGTGQICNNKYGNNGWLGIAQIWISGDHIVQGVVKMNDTYFGSATYNTPAWKNLVMCQEVGHIFGLGHQDEDFGNPALGTCMDYSADPTLNQHPNQHDYDQLAEIYAHLDGANTYREGGPTDGGGGGGRGRGKPDNVGQDIDLNDPSAWGKKVSDHLYVRDLGNGKKVITDVFWVR